MDLHVSETLGALVVLLAALFLLYRVGCWRHREPEPMDETVYERRE